MIDVSRMDDVPHGAVWQRVMFGSTSLQRVGSTGGITHMMVYLCSDRAAWVTDQTFYVDLGHRHAPRG